MKLNEDRGKLVGGLIVGEHDEVIAIKNSGQVTRSAVSDVPAKGRDTMGVKFVGVRGDDEVAVIALYPESEDAEEDEATEEAVDGTVGETAAEEAAVVSPEESTDE